MSKLTVNFNETVGKIKPLHAVNNGPKQMSADQSRGNMDSWIKAGIPYARNHDAAFSSSYGGEHTVDIGNIFPDFDADVNDPASYDFTLTDLYCQTIQEGGTKVFYRLGNKIEHWIKKYGTLPPKDFHKWAQICEHIIMHYTEGWADGYHWDIEYWEIWNEPDLDPDDSPNKRTWGGTASEFFELYRLTAFHLKKHFPNLKIGGPALAGNLQWMESFLNAMTDGVRVPIDFFSWHIYTDDPKKLLSKAKIIRKMLDQFGYTETESICNEWSVKCSIEDSCLYAAAAKDDSGKTAMMICNYTDDDNEHSSKTVTLDVAGGAEEYEMFLLDKEHSMESVGKISENSRIEMPPNSVVLLKS